MGWLLWSSHSFNATLFDWLKSCYNAVDISVAILMGYVQLSSYAVKLSHVGLQGFWLSMLLTHLFLAMTSSFCHLAFSIFPLSCVLNLTVIVFFAVSLVLKQLWLELILTELWWFPESFWEKHHPFNIWSKSEALPSFNGRVACSVPLFMGKGVPAGDACWWPVCLPSSTTLVDTWSGILSSSISRTRMLRSETLSASCTLAFEPRLIVSASLSSGNACNWLHEQVTCDHWLCRIIWHAVVHRGTFTTT